GMPIVLNPMYIIPFILVPLAFAVTGYFATTSGLVPIIGTLAPWTTPPVVGAFISTGSFLGALVAVFNIVLGTVMYMPFVIASDRKAALEESQGLSQ
ncbi:MAG: PTS lactose transporter subunit IIC, partial [Clostridium sp.]